MSDRKLTDLSIDELSILMELASPLNQFTLDDEAYMSLAEKGLLMVVERPAYTISPAGLRALADALAAGELEPLMLGAAPWTEN